MYKAKAKNAQEAHEAIRPTNLELTPERAAKYLDKDQLRLYELVWKRMMASQMEAVVLDQVAIIIESADKSARFRATGATIAFDGFYRLYNESRDEEDQEEGERILPAVKVGEALEMKKITPEQHFTQPPPRYSEAGLVKRLEELGIGRPSTYASIISVLQDRGYVRLDKKRFLPEQRGRIVTAFLVSFFKRYVEYDFTAHLEEELDFVSDGKMNWKQLLREFWKDFSTNIEQVSRHDTADIISTLDMLLERSLFTPDQNGNISRECPSCKEGKLNLRMGKFGPFIACSNYPECKFTKQISEGGDSDGSMPAEMAVGPKVLGKDPITKMEVVLKKGPYGYYIQLGEAADKKDKPKRAAIPKDIDPLAMNLDQALALLALPREVGIHPETNKKITAGFGRFGPYILHDGKYVSLKGEDSVLTIGINRAVALLAEKSKQSSNEPLRVLGAHPEDGEQIAIFSGRYGPYIKHKKTNATLPKGTASEDVTLQQAIEIVTAKAGSGTATKKKGSKAAAAKKPRAKKEPSGEKETPKKKTSRSKKTG